MHSLGKGCAAVFAVAVSIVVLCSTSTVFSALIAPGTNAIATAVPLPGGALIDTTGVVNITATSFSGTLVSQVYAGDALNPGGLTFTYQLTNDNSSVDPMEKLTVADFTGVLTDMGYDTGGGVAPSAVNRTSNQAVVGFSFVDAPLGFGALEPGLTSAVLIVRTNATTYDHTLASVIDGSVTMIDSLAPAVLTPEPAEIGFLACGMLLALKRMRRP